MRHVARQIRQFGTALAGHHKATIDAGDLQPPSQVDDDPVSLPRECPRTHPEQYRASWTRGQVVRRHHVWTEFLAVRPVGSVHHVPETDLTLRELLGLARHTECHIHAHPGAPKKLKATGDLAL